MCCNLLQLVFICSALLSACLLSKWNHYTEEHHFSISVYNGEETEPAYNLPQVQSKETVLTVLLYILTVHYTNIPITVLFWLIFIVNIYDAYHESDMYLGPPKHSWSRDRIFKGATKCPGLIPAPPSSHRQVEILAYILIVVKYIWKWLNVLHFFLMDDFQKDYIWIW